MAPCTNQSLLRPPPLTSISLRRKGHVFSRIVLVRVAAVFVSEEPDPLLHAALSAAWVRDHESRRADPLFIDPYAAGLLSPNSCFDDKNEFLNSTSLCYSHRYRLTTKFIDDKLEKLLSTSDELRQIVLLSDGMDTRPYRLSWPRLSIIYEISPERIFKLATQRLKGIGAKTSRNCLLFQFPIESRNLLEVLCKNGFNGNRPSLWVLQGLPLETVTRLEALLILVSSLAMKGSIFLGELKVPSDFTGPGAKDEFIERLFLRHGLRVSLIDYSEVAGNAGLDLVKGFEDPGNMDPVLRSENPGNADPVIGLENPGNADPVVGSENPGNEDPVLGSENPGNVLFLAEQLRMSDSQMENWRLHFERMEEEADEDGFEEL